MSSGRTDMKDSAVSHAHKRRCSCSSEPRLWRTRRTTPETPRTGPTPSSREARLADDPVWTPPRPRVRQSDTAGPSKATPAAASVTAVRQAQFKMSNR